MESIWLRSQNIHCHNQLPIFFKETARGPPLPPLVTTSSTLACGGILSSQLTTQAQQLAGACLFPLFTTNQDIGYTSLRGHSLLPADHSGPIASGGLPLPHFYHKSDPILAGAYLLPYPRLRYLPGDSKSHILFCKESGMNSEDIYI